MHALTVTLDARQALPARYFVAPLITSSGSTTVETPSAFMIRVSTAAVGGKKRKFMAFRTSAALRTGTTAPCRPP